MHAGRTPAVVLSPNATWPMRLPCIYLSTPLRNASLRARQACRTLGDNVHTRSPAMQAAFGVSEQHTRHRHVAVVGELSTRGRSSFDNVCDVVSELDMTGLEPQAGEDPVMNVSRRAHPTGPRQGAVGIGLAASLRTT